MLSQNIGGWISIYIDCWCQNWRTLFIITQHDFTEPKQWTALNEVYFQYRNYKNAQLQNLFNNYNYFSRQNPYRPFTTTTTTTTTTTKTTRRPTFSNLVIEQYEGQCGRRLNSYRRGVKQQHDIKIDILKRHVNTAPLPSRAELICLGFHEAGQIFSFYLYSRY